MASPPDYSRFQNLTYDGFRELASDPRLSAIEKIGFPDSYRRGFEDKIYADLLSKVPRLAAEGSVVVDLGCGCSPLAHAFIAQAERRQQQLYLVDSAEMLAHLPAAAPRVHHVAGRFPQCADALQPVLGAVDAIVVYSVIQYVFVEASIFDFLDRLLVLLKPGGRALIGDLPNASMRKRFLASEEGIRFQQAYPGGPAAPDARFEVAHGLMDDAVVVSLLSRARAAGFHAYVLPQGPELPMANRREDLLIVRP